MKLLFLFFIFFLAQISVLSQVITISGRVKDSYNQPISDVVVTGVNSGISVLTDNFGYFEIILPDTISEISFSKVSYYSITELIKKRKKIDIVLKGLDLVELSLKDLLQVNVSTVSLNEQKIIDAPGVVSIITYDQLKQLGIRTIREALTLIPGFVPLQNDDEQILAVRGIYATTNQKILVMRDGHSLNEANIDLPQTDYSLSIENIKKIEIIRGPGASIYGNSALAAVVNIITTDEEGSKVKVGLGNYGQYNVDAVSCIKLKDNGYFMVYGRYSGTQGQPYDVTVNTGKNTSYKGTYYTNHYPNNYDIGFRYKNNIVTSSFSARLHNYKTYWSANGLYTNVDSLLALPGLEQECYHYDLLVNPKIKDNIQLHLQHFIDFSKLTNHRLLGAIDDSVYLKGYMQLNEWNVVKSGINYYSSIQYSDNGLIVGGIFLEKRQYLDSWLASNKSTPSMIALSTKPFFSRGHEVRAAGYFQVQQPLNNWLSMDLGARYDWAEDYSATFNPRIALIANLKRQLSFKTIYTRAFQTPGYSYRTSNASFSGSINNLDPERLTTFQASVRYEYKKVSFIELTAYHNKLSNLISRRPGKNYYENIGRFASYGFEAEGQYNTNNYSLFFNYSYLLPNNAAMDSLTLNSNVINHTFKNFPKNSANFGVTLFLFNKLQFSIYSQYYSRFNASYNTVVNSRILFNSSITVQNILKGIEFECSLYNLTNYKYKLGDPSVKPIEQPGRWFMFSVLYHFM